MTLAQLALEIDPTPAMDAGTQTVWQCSMCGTVVVLTSLATTKRPGQCPGHDESGQWRRQRLPVAGLREKAAAVNVDDARDALTYMVASGAHHKGYQRLMGRIDQALREAS